MTGRVVVITGASAGIGLACARALAARGDAVVLSARRTDLLDAAVAAIREAGGEALAVTGDVTNEADMTTLVARAVEEYGRLDVMIANAGIGYHDQFEATPPDVMQRLVDVNLMGTLYAARAAALQFKAQNSGHLIVMSSIVARRGIAGSSVYSATKAAQAGLVESLRAEWHGTPLRASAVYPVSTATEFHDAIQRDYGFEVHGMGPKQQASSVADAVVRCIDRPRPEVYPYGRARLLSILNILAPGMADRLVQRFSRRRRQ
ncbi:MAG: SDR family NAD(P)-dependent oxidoreductase [Acidobacteria bacterium]|nr:SDR family NAD(P)-dependent oxidoreductase [Acidobacteriota bacterium]